MAVDYINHSATLSNAHLPSFFLFRRQISILTPRKSEGTAFSPHPNLLNFTLHHKQCQCLTTSTPVKIKQNTTQHNMKTTTNFSTHPGRWGIFGKSSYSRAQTGSGSPTPHTVYTISTYKQQLPSRSPARSSPPPITHTTEDLTLHLIDAMQENGIEKNGPTSPMPDRGSKGSGEVGARCGRIIADSYGKDTVTRPRSSTLQRHSSTRPLPTPLQHNSAASSSPRTYPSSPPHCPTIFHVPPPPDPDIAIEQPSGYSCLFPSSSTFLLEIAITDDDNSQSKYLSSFENCYYPSTKSEVLVSEKEEVEGLMDLGRPRRRKRGGR